MAVGKQLEILIHDLRISQSEFAKQTGLSKQTVNNIISGRHVTKTDVLEKILGAYPELNLNWLMNGTGNQWIGSDTPAKGRQKSKEPQSQDGEMTYKELVSEIEHLKEKIRLKDEIIDLLRKR
ncbi:MAG: helix-turn-helix transcriptional regulator [Bacteroidetes bacterium]|nr:helix-turn-helix transcriptional regulator [Bacteroidota bacterium]